MQSEARSSRSLVLCVMFCISLFVLLYLFFSPLCCLSFFDLRILITFWYFQTLLHSNIKTWQFDSLKKLWSFWTKMKGDLQDTTLKKTENTMAKLRCCYCVLRNIIYIIARSVIIVLKQLKYLICVKTNKKIKKRVSKQHIYFVVSLFCDKDVHVQGQWEILILMIKINFH
jgi:hypothetical protein